MEIKKIDEMMSGIKPGDRIFFNSYGSCHTTSQLVRNLGATIPATGTVLKVYPRYVLVELKGTRECVMWDSIARVNGIDWPLYNEGDAK